jgi:hypothetical protein
LLAELGEDIRWKKFVHVALKPPGIFSIIETPDFVRVERIARPLETLMGASMSRDICLKSTNSIVVTVSSDDLAIGCANSGANDDFSLVLCRERRFPVTSARGLASGRYGLKSGARAGADIAPSSATTHSPLGDNLNRLSRRTLGQSPAA